MLIHRIVCQRVGDGKEIAIGLVRKLSETSTELVGRLTSAEKIDRLREDPNFLVSSLAEDVLGMAREVGVRERASHGQLDKPLSSSFDLEHSALFELEEGSESRAEEILVSICQPFTAADLNVLTDIRIRAFGERPPFSHPFLQREAIFRALGHVVDEEKKRILLESSPWNPMWPDGNLSLDQIISVPAIVAGAESSGVGNKFQLGNQTILHCFDFKPPLHEGMPELYEIAAALVSKYFFDGRPDVENFCQQMSVFDKSPPPHARSIIASTQEPAVVRFTPEFRVGGHFTPAMPSKRLVELSGPEGFERITWKDGRRWDLWGPGRVLSQGAALMADTSRIGAIKDYELIWLVFHNEVITHAFHQGRGLFYRRRHES